MVRNKPIAVDLLRLHATPNIFAKLMFLWMHSKHTFNDSVPGSTPLRATSTPRRTIVSSWIITQNACLKTIIRNSRPVTFINLQYKATVSNNLWQPIRVQSRALNNCKPFDVLNYSMTTIINILVLHIGNCSSNILLNTSTTDTAVNCIGWVNKLSDWWVVWLFQELLTYVQ